jgi:hypothetical protein
MPRSKRKQRGIVQDERAQEQPDSGSFGREDALVGRTRKRLRLPVLFKLPREPQKAPYQVCVLSPYFGILQRHRFLAK